VLPSRPTFAQFARRTLAALAITPLAFAALAAQQLSLETRDPAQKQDESFEKAYKEWIVDPRFGSPLVDHLPLVPGIPTPRDMLGYHIGAPRTLTYYETSSSTIARWPRRHRA
jgi:hypothetical protein